MKVIVFTPVGLIETISSTVKALQSIKHLPEGDITGLDSTLILDDVIIDGMRMDTTVIKTDLKEHTERMSTLREIVNEQAEDDNLFFVPKTITEEVLMRALRRLHHAIEED